MKSARTAARALTASALAAMVVLTGCSAAKTGEPAPQSSGGDHELHLPADYSGEGPGTLRSAITLPTVDRRIIREDPRAVDSKKFAVASLGVYPKVKMA